MIPVTLEDKMTTPVAVSPRPAAPAPAAAALTLGDLLRILRQRMFLILFIFILVVGATVAGTYLLIKYRPLYEASSAIMVQSPFPKQPLEMVQPFVQVEVMNRYVADQKVRVQSEQVLREALTDRDVMNTEWYRMQPNASVALEELKADLVVTQIPDSSFLKIAFSTRNKKDAPIIVNTVIAKYLAAVQRDQRSQLEDELAEKKSQYNRMQSELASIRNLKEEFVRNLSSPGATMGLNVIGETWRVMEEEATRLMAEKLRAQATYTNLVGVAPSQIATSPQMQMLIQQDPMVVQYQNEIFRLQQHIDAHLSRGFGENHRTVQDLKTQLASTQQQLDQLIAKKEQQYQEFQLNQARTEFLNLTQAEADIRERAMEQQSKQRALDQSLSTYQNYLDRQALLEEQSKALNDYINQLSMVASGKEIVRVQQWGRAEEPLERSFPRWSVNLPAGVLLGLLLGVGTATLLELSDTRVKTTRDLVRHVHVPILGAVPHVDDEEVNIDPVELASHSHPRSMVAEAFRTIRTNLLLSSPAERQRSVLVTSARPEEGKTSVATNLAISLAQSGRRVLLIDANFRRPAMHRIFPKSAKDGLSNILVGQGRLEELVRSTDLPNLDVLTSGPLPPNPAELLSGPYFQQLLTAATERYDQVIIDGPPVLVASDALVLAGTVDGVILVSQAKTSSRGVVIRAREQIERVNGRIFGAVLNAAHVARGGYYREQMRTYYEYQSDEPLPVQSAKALPNDGDGPQA